MKSELQLSQSSLIEIEAKVLNKCECRWNSELNHLIPNTSLSGWCTASMTNLPNQSRPSMMLIANHGSVLLIWETLKQSNPTRTCTNCKYQSLMINCLKKYVPPLPVSVYPSDTRFLSRKFPPTIAPSPTSLPQSSAPTLPKQESTLLLRSPSS